MKGNGTQTCLLCGRPRLENCERGTQHNSPCAFSKCENLSRHEVELLQLKHKKGLPLINWVDQVETLTVVKTGRQFVAHSRTRMEDKKNWVIVRGANLKLKIMSAEQFDLTRTEHRRRATD